MKTEFEFYLLRVYVRPFGWRLTVCEVMNFDTGNDWCLFSIDRDKTKTATWRLTWLCLLAVCVSLMCIAAAPPVLPVVAPLAPDGPYLQGATNESSSVISPLVGQVAARTNVFWFTGQTRKVGIHRNGETVYRQYGREITGHSAIFMFNGKEYSFPFDGWKDRNISRLLIMRGGRPVFVATNEVTITVNTPEPL